jgi:hypothetical protein
MKWLNQKLFLILPLLSILLLTVNNNLKLKNMNFFVNNHSIKKI